MSWLEWLSQKATDFVGSSRGAVTAFAVMAAWLAAAAAWGNDAARQYAGDAVAAVTFVLLFLLQRSQTKDTLAIQLKLNELLAAVHKASPELINVEKRPESEVRELHDRYEELQQAGPGARSIAECGRDGHSPAAAGE
ncbi:MAG TPA: low affinity iron permease family protein [Gemmataceae bacterium]|jgi:low affinity Fe/Cu permease